MRASVRVFSLISSHVGLQVTIQNVFRLELLLTRWTLESSDPLVLVSYMRPYVSLQHLFTTEMADIPWAVSVGVLSAGVNDFHVAFVINASCKLHSAEVANEVLWAVHISDMALQKGGVGGLVFVTLGASLRLEVLFP